MRSVSNELAAEEYALRHGREAQLDHWLGWSLATIVEATRRLMFAADQTKRRLDGSKARSAPGPLPGWTKTALDTLEPVLRHMGTAGALVVSPLPRQILVGKAEWPDAIAALPSLSGAVDSVFLKRAAKEPLRVFYEGVRAVFTLRGETPRPSDMALLSGAIGMEEYDQVAPVRRRWEDRLRIWRRDPLNLELEGFRNLPIEKVDQIAVSLAAGRNSIPARAPRPPEKHA